MNGRENAAAAPNDAAASCEASAPAEVPTLTVAEALAEGL